jgi:hypothetical protein
MKLRERRIGLLVLVTAALLSLTAQSPRPVNPLVVRTPQPGSAPADCAQSLAPVPPPRVAIDEIPRPEIAPVEAPAPPTGSLRAALHATQTALAENDRRAFDESLRTARSLLATYPSGAERRTGEELVRIYEGAARLWDAQYQSPFFNQSSPEYEIVSGYPGYADAVRRSTLTDRSGQRFYPAAESRDFLGRVAADRLRGIGIQAPTRVAERTPASTSRPRSTTTLAPTVTTNTPSASTPRATPRRTTTATTGTVRPPRPRRSAPVIASRPRSSSTSEPRTSAPVTPTPGSSPNPSASPTTAAAPEPAAPVAGTEEPPATTPPAAGESPAAATPDTIAAATETAPVPTDTTVTTDTAPSPVPATTTTSRTRSVILPTILILIGLAVLIVLFRASK